MSRTEPQFSERFSSPPFRDMLPWFFAEGRAVAMKELDSTDNNEEQSQESTQPATIVDRADLTEVHEAANTLIESLAGVPDGDMVGEIVANALKLLRDQTN